MEKIKPIPVDVEKLIANFYGGWLFLTRYCISGKIFTLSLYKWNHY
jgi:hypothetical protein